MERNYRRGGRRNWRIRFVDETEYLTEETIEALPPGARLISAYIFDPGEVTHICSFQGSQWHVGICTWIQPADYDSWHEWCENDPDGEHEKLRDELELGAPPQDDYFGDRGEADSIDSGIRVRRFRTGDTWECALTASTNQGAPGETNWEEAANQLIESEQCNTFIPALFEKWEAENEQARAA